MSTPSARPSTRVARLLTLAALLAGAACGGRYEGTGDDDDRVDAPPGRPGPDAPAGAADAADAASAPVAGDQVDFTAYPESRGGADPSWGAVLTDIAQHLPPEYGDQYWDGDLVTAGHETTHGINSDIRNHHNDTGERANGFYVLEDRAVVVVEPGIRKSDVVPFVPSSLRGSRFGLYLLGQTEWDDTPLYVWDEWVAYVNGGAVGVDLAEAGLWSYGWRDAVAGPLEFTAYALAVGLAVKERDPDYFAANRQFREFLAWNSRRALDVFRRGRGRPDFAWDEQDALYEALRTGADAAALRQFARDTFGDAWMSAVLEL